MNIKMRKLYYLYFMHTSRRLGNSKWKNFRDKIDLIRNIFSAEVLNLLVSDTRQTEILASDSW